ncbi:hypothetical protein ACPUEK_00030 [Marinomonas gallaica]|uniref:hypothetical protein n=1 Tax=Marinomonas gallaica TaxID=1806667 RepID=UPI0008318CC5|nr:hypothetical protein [Marinomonas gallaica]
MSDVLSDAQMFLSEPDETVLTAALRNKDDIPILMDIVGADDAVTPISQEMHLKKSLFSDEAETQKPTPTFKYEAPEKKTKFQYEPPEKGAEFNYEPPEAITETVSDSVSQTVEHVATAVQPNTAGKDQSQLIADAVKSVLERRLPELVAEVMMEISRHDDP